MGLGIKFHCQTCNMRFQVMLGIGYLPFILNEEITKEIQNGDYGEEWKNLLASDKSHFIEAETAVYRCSCGSWKNEDDIILYRINPETNRRNIVKKYIHHCTRCGKKMKKMREEEILSLPCPICHTDVSVENTICWD